jgi:2-octaprenyl-6-methoxyphenol hydroxylase
LSWPVVGCEFWVVGKSAGSALLLPTTYNPQPYYHRAMTDIHDILIIGGGLVGASLAIALDGAGLRVALVEAAPPKVDSQPSYDERNLALARASVNALTALGVWARAGARAMPIRKIHISRQGEFGAVRLDARKHGIDAFGAVLPARELGNGLLARLETCRELVRYAPATLTAIAAQACSSARMAPIRLCVRRSV